MTYLEQMYTRFLNPAGWDKRYKSFKDIQFLDEISSNLPNDLFGTNAYKALKSC